LTGALLRTVFGIKWEELMEVWFMTDDAVFKVE
jgi:hypothetical protein